LWRGEDNEMFCCRGGFETRPCLQSTMQTCQTPKIWSKSQNQGGFKTRPYESMQMITEHGVTSMKYNPDIHHRRSIRLKGYDYSQAGAYFVTICICNKECLLGDIVDGEMRLSNYGNIAKKCWDDLPNHYSYIGLDAFIIMPNHVHGIIVIDYIVGAGFKPARFKPALLDNHVVNNRAGLKPAPTTKYYGLPEIVRAFKTFSSRQINRVRNTPGVPVWQRNYYEHIIRNESELYKIREYIVGNSLNWKDDENYNE
jgi:putative transposase